jgi:Domain of unknown function (DUF4402)
MRWHGVIAAAITIYFQIIWERCGPLKKTQGIPLMKKIMTIAVATMAMMAAAPAFAAGNTAFDTAEANATVVAPVTVTKTADLNFGTVIVGHGGVSVDTAGVRTSVTGANFLTSGATPAAAAFDVAGETARTVILAVANTSPVGALSLDGAKMTFPTIANLVLAAGANSVKVAGSLASSVNAPGAYTGSFTLTATYQ